MKIGVIFFTEFSQIFDIFRQPHKMMQRMTWKSVVSVSFTTWQGQQVVESRRNYMRRSFIFESIAMYMIECIIASHYSDFSWIPNTLRKTSVAFGTAKGICL